MTRTTRAGAGFGMLGTFLIAIAAAWLLIVPGQTAWAQGGDEEPEGAPPRGAPPPEGAPPRRRAAPSRWARGCGGSTWRYRGLMRRLYIPQDRRQYGVCREWGRWSGRSYRGYTNLPRGAFWVWRAPHWYIYRFRRRFAAVPPPVRGVRGCAGSRWRYSGLMRRLYIPQDRGQYGVCREWGRWSGRSYRGYRNLPRGAYWVWRAPYWYIYRRRVVGY